MLILWIRKNKNGETAGATKEDTRKTFQKHDETMKKFCHTHPKIEPAPARDIAEEDLFLAPVHWVRLNKNAQN
jgi:hypothetical protein